MREIKFIYTVVKPTIVFSSEPMTIEEIERGNAKKFLSMNGFLPTSHQCYRREYTGLKDKNGKEIYKDDIVSDGGTIRRVKWSDQNASFYLSHIVDNRSFYKEFIECAQFQSDGPVQLPDIEVIGNIHQNPELLTTSPSSKTEGDAAGE